MEKKQKKVDEKMPKIGQLGNTDGVLYAHKGSIQTYTLSVEEWIMKWI